jgi:1-deoxy-D-xylulose-5-phosphate reductoisomerase
MQYITILGATGSIGVSTLDVLARHTDRYAIYALTAHHRVEELAIQCERFRPKIAVTGSAEGAQRLLKIFREKKLNIDVAYGEAALCEVASASACHTVMAAIVGAVGLAPTLAAARAGKKILLANKEALVMSGRLFMDAVKANNATLMPIDSEHNAIFQCLPHHYQYSALEDGIAKILLTASGGPFLSRSIDTFNTITPEEAVAHPKWTMGRKISVDSATMMNKGLEVIEAHWLFGAPASQIEVVIHPQSIIHSMVSYIDGSVLAQLGNPDMRTPIAHALAYPERIDSGVNPIDLVTIGKLTFEAPDFKRFPCLKFAYAALESGGTAPAMLNAANEIAVQAFLEKKIGFDMINQLIARVMDKLSYSEVTSIEHLLEQDCRARTTAQSFI